MNVRVDVRMSRGEFLAWARNQTDARHEWVDGEVVMMVSVRRVHNQIVLNAVLALSARIDAERWNVRFSEFGIDMARSIRVPDVFVEPAGGARDATLGTDAALVIEVLSPSSTKADLIQKPREYAGLRSLSLYVVLSAEERRAYVWRRTEDGTLGAEPEEITSGAIDVPAIGASLPVDALYARTGLT